ncbi:heavy-metal-associated domain-containing protein [Flavitalea flava]
MKTLQFKTNIKCSGCIASVTPFLNKAVGEKNWEVDITKPEKLLTIRPDSAAVTSKEVTAALKEAGYTSEAVN